MISPKPPKQAANRNNNSTQKKHSRNTKSPFTGGGRSTRPRRVTSPGMFAKRRHRHAPNRADGSERCFPTLRPVSATDSSIDADGSCRNAADVSQGLIPRPSSHTAVTVDAIPQNIFPRRYKIIWVRCC